jgi:hypothetical protein
MTIIKSNHSLKNEDKKFVISRKIIKEFAVKINRLKNDRCGTEVFSVLKNIYNKKVKEKITKDLLLRQVNTHWITQPMCILVTGEFPGNQPCAIL